MKKCTLLTSPSTDLSGTQFSTLKRVGINDPEGPEKYIITEVKTNDNDPKQNINMLLF
jgi:hypothetical protein